jgi:hypothetical protein
MTEFGDQIYYLFCKFVSTVGRLFFFNLKINSEGLNGNCLIASYTITEKEKIYNSQCTCYLGWKNLSISTKTTTNVSITS